MIKRKYKLSKLWVLREVGDGVRVLMYGFSDLSNDDLSEQYTYYLDRQDFEYLAHLKAEADLRGIKLKIKR